MASHFAATGIHATTFTQLTASGSLQLPAGVTVEASANRLNGNGWSLLMTGSNPPGLQCDATAAAVALAATSPAAWWALDESGTSFSDRIGSAHLTAAGTAPVRQQPPLVAQTGPSLCFNATGSHLTTASSIQTDVAALSVAAWVRVPSGMGTAVVYQNRGPVWAGQRGFSLTVSNGQVRWGMDTDNLFHGPVSTATINDGQAHHVAGTWNGSQYTIYIDGIAAGTSTHTGGPYSSTQPSLIGFHQSWGLSSSGSCFSDIAVWNRALSGAEVAAIATAGR